MTRPRAFGYFRDSDRTGSNGSPTARITDYAEQQDLPLVVIIRDDVGCIGLPLSERPGGRQLLRRLRPGDHVVLARLEDIFEKGMNTLVTLCNWSAAGITVHVVTEDGGFELGNEVAEEVLRICGTIIQTFPPSLASSA